MFGEIFICQFPFTSGAFSKPRPVLVLFDLQQDVVICRVTSLQRSGASDVSLQDWTQEGLARPSIARLDRLVTAEKTNLGRHLGRLSLQDEARIRAAWNQHMKL
ncbi:MAG: type II toxin-antitoxin system PemK/MazF family toxin [Verrucomicrobia bacterium]|nr:type II toxin-antitoxin system PemK/MazF family toxin [Verrucomicrobiota bacterium]